MGLGMPIRRDELCFAYHKVLGLFPVSAIDFDRSVLLDHMNTEYTIESCSRIIFSGTHLPISIGGAYVSDSSSITSAQLKDINKVGCTFQYSGNYEKKKSPTRIVVFAYRKGYGLFPVEKIDFYNCVLYDYHGIGHRLGKVAKIIMANKGGVFLVS